MGVNKGGTSGGAIPAILINAPGTPEAAATAMDGHPLARKGKPEKAMKTALYSSVFRRHFLGHHADSAGGAHCRRCAQIRPGGVYLHYPVSFTLIAALAGKSLVKGVLAAALGVFLSSWGLDPVDSTERLTFGMVELFDGIPLLPFAIGTLALSSVVSQLFDLRRQGEERREVPRTAAEFKADNKLGVGEFWSGWKTLLRSAGIGTVVGMLPGLGVTLAAFLGYGAAKRSSKHSEEFGKGRLEGIQATEAANSAVVGSNLIPTIALGIPGNVAAAVLIGAFEIHGVVPGPLMIREHGVLIYSIFASMLLANVAHILIGRVGIRLWVQFVRIPKNVVLPTVVVLCVIGVYIPSNSMFHVALLVRVRRPRLFDAEGWILHRLFGDRLYSGR